MISFMAKKEQSHPVIQHAAQGFVVVVGRDITAMSQASTGWRLPQMKSLIIRVGKLTKGRG